MRSDSFLQILPEMFMEICHIFWRECMTVAGKPRQINIRIEVLPFALEFGGAHLIFFLLVVDF